MKPFVGSVAALLLACSAGPEGGVAVERRGASEKLLPYSEFEGALWPEGEQVVVLSAGVDGDESTFVAYGVDVGSKEVRYAITGDREQFVEFKARLAKEVFKAPAPCRIDLGQVPTPLPPPVNPEGDPFAEVVRRAYVAVADACAQ